MTEAELKAIEDQVNSVDQKIYVKNHIALIAEVRRLQTVTGQDMVIEQFNMLKEENARLSSRCSELENNFYLLEGENVAHRQANENLSAETAALHKENARLREENSSLRSALKGLYEHTKNYIEINALGDVHHNTCMKKARAALKETIVATPNPEMERIVPTGGHHSDQKLSESDTMVLSGRDRDTFLAAVENPPAPNADLIKAAAHFMLKNKELMEDLAKQEEAEKKGEDE